MSGKDPMELDIAGEEFINCLLHFDSFGFVSIIALLFKCHGDYSRVDFKVKEKV